MTRCFVKFASLFAVVALFLGLMVTGCSEGDNTAGEVGAKTLLNTVVGISPEVAGKGYADAATKYLAVGVTNKDGSVYVDEEPVGELYSADGKIGAEAQEAFEEMFSKDITATAWEDLGDNKVLTSMVLDEYVLAQAPTGIAVYAFDQSGIPLGMFTADVDFNAQGITAVDLVEEGSEFIAVKDMDCEIKVANAGEDKVMHLATGEPKEVEVQAVYSYKGEEVGYHSVAGFTLFTESANIKTDDTEGTVKGLVASDADDNVVTVTWTHPITEKVLTCEFKVEVEDLVVTLTCADGMFPDWSNKEFVTIDSVRVNDKEQLYGGEELTWDGSESKIEYVLDEIPVAVGDEVAVHCVKHADKDYEGEAAKITVTTDAVANTITVTGWRDVFQASRVFLVNDFDYTGETLADGDIVVYELLHNTGLGETVTWACDGTTQKTRIAVCQDGDKVLVRKVQLYKGGLTGPEYEGLFAGEVDTYTVEVKKGGDYDAVIVNWVRVFP